MFYRNVRALPPAAFLFPEFKIRCRSHCCIALMMSATNHPCMHRSVHASQQEMTIDTCFSKVLGAVSPNEEAPSSYRAEASNSIVPLLISMPYFSCRVRWWLDVCCTVCWFVVWKSFQHTSCSILSRLGVWTNPQLKCLQHSLDSTIMRYSESEIWYRIKFEEMCIVCIVYGGGTAWGTVRLSIVHPLYFIITPHHDIHHIVHYSSHPSTHVHFVYPYHLKFVISIFQYHILGISQPH